MFKNLKIQWWILPLVIIIKVSLLLYFSYSHNPEKFSEGILFELPSEGWGDEGYITCAENFYTNGDWYFAKGKMVAPRVPIVGIGYLFFRLFFSYQWALNFYMIGLSIFMSYSIFKLLKTLSKKFGPSFFYIGILLFLADNYISIWNNHPELAESLSFSFFSLTLVHIYEYIEHKHIKSIFFGGLFLALAIFARIVFLPLLFLFAGWIFIKERKTAIKALLFFLLTSAVFESIWVTRNYFASDGKIILIQQIGSSEHKTGKVGVIHEANFTTVPLFEKQKKLIKGFGGRSNKWDPEGQMYWFMDDDYQHELGFKPQNQSSLFPEIIYDNEKGLTPELLVECQRNSKIARNKNIDLSERKKSLEVALKITDKFYKNLTQHHWFYYQIIGRIKTFKAWLFNSGTYQLPFSLENATLPQIGIKIISFLTYQIIIILGLLGSVYYLFELIRSLFKKKNSVFFFLTISTLYHIGLYIIILRTAEYRYNLSVYYSFFFISTLLLSLVIKRIPFKLGFLLSKQKTTNKL